RVQRIGVEFHPHVIWLDAPEIDLDAVIPRTVALLHADGPKAHIRPSRGDLALPGDEFGAGLTLVSGTRVMCRRERDVVFFYVLPHSSVRGVRRSQARDTFTNTADPTPGHSAAVAVVEQRDNLLLEQCVQSIGFGSIPGRVVAVLLAVADRPPHIRR